MAVVGKLGTGGGIPVTKEIPTNPSIAEGQQGDVLTEIKKNGNGIITQKNISEHISNYIERPYVSEVKLVHLLAPQQYPPFLPPQKKTSARYVRPSDHHIFPLGAMVL